PKHDTYRAMRGRSSARMAPLGTRVREAISALAKDLGCREPVDEGPARGAARGVLDEIEAVRDSASWSAPPSLSCPPSEPVADRSPPATGRKTERSPGYPVAAGKRAGARPEIAASGRIPGAIIAA